MKTLARTLLTVAVALGMVTGAMAAWLTPELAADGYTEQDLQNALVRDGAGPKRSYRGEPAASESGISWRRQVSTTQAA